MENNKEYYGLLRQKSRSHRFLGMDEFPKVLSKDEICNLIREYKRTGDNKLREKIIMNNLRYVSRYALKYAHLYDGDDLFSIGLIGVMKAIKTYRIDDIEHDDDAIYKTWNMYVTRSIVNDILQFIDKKHLRHAKREMSLEFTIATNDNDDDVALIDKLEDESIDNNPEYNICSIDMDKYLRCLIDEKLKPKEKEILLYYFGFNGQKLSTKQLADKMGLGTNYVHKLKRRGVAILRKYKNSIIQD